jgi:hypothetical protein
MSTQQNVKSELISISSRFLKEYPQFFDKALSVYEMFVEEQTEEIAQAYGLSFIKLPKEHFEKLIPFLRKYARNHLLLQYYYDYLFTGIRDHPVICLELLSHFQNDKPIDISKRQFYHKEKVFQLLLNIHSILMEDDEDENEEYLATAIRVVDQILLNDEYRPFAHREINKSEI